MKTDFLGTQKLQVKLIAGYTSEARLEHAAEEPGFCCWLLVCTHLFQLYLPYLVISFIFNWFMLREMLKVRKTAKFSFSSNVVQFYFQGKKISYIYS